MFYCPSLSDAKPSGWHFFSKPDQEQPIIGATGVDFMSF
jgi:hypothetical protein